MLAITLIAFLLYPAQADATNAISLLAQGTKAAGRGGAGVAVPDDALSQAHNPALLMEIPNIRFDIALIVIHERVRERTQFADDTTSAILGLPIPTLAVSVDPMIGGGDLDDAGFYENEDGYQVGSNVRIGFGIFEPIALVLSPTVTLAVRATPTLSFGISLNVLLTFLEFELNAGVGGAGGEDPDYVPGGTVRTFRQADGTPIDPPQNFDAGTGRPVTWAEVFGLLSTGESSGSGGATSVIKIEELFGAGVAGSVGALWTPRSDFNIGLSVRTPGIIFNPEAKGSIDFNRTVDGLQNDPALGGLIGPLLQTFLPDGGANGFQSDYDIELEDDHLILPAQAAIGVAWWPTDNWLLTLDVKWIGWSHAFDEINVVAKGGKNADINEINGSPDINYRVELEWDDQFVFAIGTAVSPTDWLTLRCGFNHGGNPVPDDTAFANSIVIENHVTLGASLFLGNVDIDIAYAYGLPVEVDQDTSAFKTDQHNLYIGIGYQW